MSYVKIDPILKARWVAALRSGDYAQGREVFLDSVTNQYCCLGVLCEVADVPVHMEFGTNLADNYSDVRELLVARYPQDNPIVEDLWRMNDSLQKSFDEIADFVEENL